MIWLELLVVHRRSPSPRRSRRRSPTRACRSCGAMTGRTRLIRRSALVKVPSFSRNDVPGRNTWANLAVSLRNRSWTTSSSSASSAAVRAGCSGRTGRCPRPGRTAPGTCRRARRRTCSGCAGPARSRIVRPHSCSNIVAHRVVGDVPVAGQLVRERAHVAGALHVVLAAQRVDADAVAADVAGGHGEVGHAHDHRRALAVLGDAEAVVDRRVGPGGVQPGGGAQVRRPGRR